MPRVKPKALSAPPSQEALEDGAGSTSLFTSNTVGDNAKKLIHSTL
jgi:hypothetical protein